MFLKELNNLLRFVLITLFMFCILEFLKGSYTVCAASLLHQFLIAVTVFCSGGISSETPDKLQPAGQQLLGLNYVVTERLFLNNHRTLAVYAESAPTDMCKDPITEMQEISRTRLLFYTSILLLFYTSTLLLFYSSSILLFYSSSRTQLTHCLSSCGYILTVKYCCRKRLQWFQPLVV